VTTGVFTRPIPVGRRHAGLGTTRLFWGMICILALEVVVTLSTTIAGLVDHDIHAMTHIAMWIVLLVSDLSIAVVTRVLGNHLPNWLYWMFVAALSLVVLMDLVSNWSSRNPGNMLTAAPAAAISLVLAVTTRSAAEIIAAVSGLTGAMILAFALDGGFVPPHDGPSALMLCEVFFIVVGLTLVMGQFRRLVRRELEQTLSHSTLTAPRLTVATDQSTQLARLDLAAESLLAAVADGRVQLPLTPEIARRAGQLATELRLHLLEARSKTWLDLAIAESEILSAAIAVEDPSSSAGLLNTRQRGALLSALWLLTERRTAGRRSGAGPVTVEIAPRSPGADAGGPTVLLITITVPWAGRSAIEPGVWEHFAQVGRYLEANAGRGLAVEIHSVVPAPRRVSPAHGTNSAGA